MASTAIFAVLALVAVVNAKSPKRIVGGSQAVSGEIPYQASLIAGGQNICSGAIVSSRHIVTAAHCVTPTAPTEVVTGTIFSLEGEFHRPSEIAYHDQYTPGVATSPFDIAVITLADDIIFNEVQNKIDLPTAPAPAGVLAIASGWGSLRADLPMFIPSLNKIVLQTISGEKCQEMLGPRDPIYTNQVCTFVGYGYGVCKGDSGGPLAYNGELIGVASWAISCAIDLPDVFTSVYHNLDWLNSIIHAQSLPIYFQ